MENGLTNGHDAAAPRDDYAAMKRFAAVPRAVDIPVGQGDEAEAVEVDLEELQGDPSELCMLLENENVASTYWTTIALAYAKAGRIDTAVDIMVRSLDSVGRTNAIERLPIFNALCWLYLLQSRAAPRTQLDAKDSEVKTKDHWLRAATTTLNDASRVSPSYAPLHLARGVLSLLRAALQSDPTEKTDALKQAIKSFDDSLRVTRGKNMMAHLGKARALFSFTRYTDALQAYQHVLKHAPHLTDPDPRIGIGCCFWMLGHKDDAQVAWKRALELNPKSKVANVLLGLYNLHLSSQLPMSDPQFALLYKTAMVQYIQEAFKIDNKLPLACASFGGYFLIKKGMSQVESLAKKAVKLTDVSSVASDGWYLLARREHYADELARAGDYYLRADQARGGDEQGYLPAKFGAAQIRVLQGDPDGAKFRLEKIVQKSKSTEAMTLLGSLWADEAFTGRDGASKEEIIAAQRKAIPLLEAVRTSWKDAKRNTQPDTTLLLNLARLYETESPDKALQCLEQVEQLELEELPDDLDLGEGSTEEKTAAMREYLAPQLLNNMGCFHYQAERLGRARELFQAALNACVRLGGRDGGDGEADPDIDTDALVTTVSFNLARTYEAEGSLDEARQVYKGLLARHADYVDAKMRLAYIALLQSPVDEGPQAIKQLYEAESHHPEVRALFGWYVRRAKRRTANIAEDAEQRHYKHTLQGHDKHDRYALTAMGNLYLAVAREARRDTDAERERRRKLYESAVQFFDKALQLDPRNAYAAQGVGIALIEDRGDLTGGLQIFAKVRETVRDASVYVNLGHAYCEVKQYTRAIEAYDAALAKDRGRDPQILACLGRVWLLKGKQEKSAAAMKTALDYSERVHFQFNVAFVQIQTAQLVHTLPEAQRTLAEVEEAAAGLDKAIESFVEIAQSPNPPFPRHDIEQRANMGRNTMKRQLERAAQAQREYEARNAARLREAREAREAEMARREVAEERAAMQERDRRLAEERAEEARRRAEEESDEEARKRRRREQRGTAAAGGPAGKRKKKGGGAHAESSGADGSGDDDDDFEGGGPDGSRRAAKKRRLEQRNGKSKPSSGGGGGGRTSSKYKSSEFVVDSDEEDEEEVPAAADDDDDDDLLGFGSGDGGAANGTGGASEDEDTPMVDADEGGGGGGDRDGDDAAGSAPAPPAAPARRRLKRVIDDDDEDDDEDSGDAGGGAAAATTTTAAVANGGEDDEDE